ncbi:MAG: hypothetical protein J7K40_07680 [candidate division Zixibacteria bacterium]|nr:hypothetical protein [candidate division Zixibacteria bacterium]
MAEYERHKAINILFNYVKEYETGRKFDVDEFINYFENVLSHLKLVRDQNNLDIIKGVDDSLLFEFDKVAFNSPQGGTDLRYITSHLLATMFPILIPMAAQYQEAYRFCLKLRKKRSDIDYLELELAVHLLDRSLLKRCEELRFYFLTKIAELQNLNNDPNVLEDPAYQILDKLETIQHSQLFLALRRRHLNKGSNQLMQDKQSPEYKLSEYKVFAKMADSNPIYRDILFEMKYLKTKIPFWGRFKQLFFAIFRFVMGIFRAPRYVLFVITKSRGNFVYFVFAFLALIVFLVAVFQVMGKYQDKKFVEFKKRIEEVKQR